MTLDLKRQIKENLKKDKVNKEYSALLGKTPTVVKHPSRTGYCFARLRDNLSDLIIAYNPDVAPIYDTPVKVVRNQNGWEVVGIDRDRFNNWADTGYVRDHHKKHEWNRARTMGTDVVIVYPDQFDPLLCTPNGNNVWVSPYILQRDSDFIYVGDTGTANLLTSKPTNNQALMGLVYIDKTTGNPGFVTATGTMPVSVSGSAAILPYCPYPTDSQEPLYFVRLVSGTSSIEWTNLYNARNLFDGATGTSGGVSNHESLSGLLGGSANNHYHLTPSQVVGLVSGTPTTLHSHAGSSAPYNSSDFTGTAWLDLVDGGETSLHYHATGTILHEALLDLLGGTTNEHYHLTSDQDIGLVSGTVTTLHNHTHNNLSGIQGGGVLGDIYHLSLDQIHGLVSGSVTGLHSHSIATGTYLTGTGIVGQVAEFVTNTTTLQAAKIIGPAANILTITNAAASTLAMNVTAAKTVTITATDNSSIIFTGAGNLTIPTAGSVVAALLGTANVFTAIQKINVNSATAFLVEQDGVKDNVLVVDTTNGRVGINQVPGTYGLEITANVIFQTGANYSINRISDDANAPTFIGYKKKDASAIPGTGYGLFQLSGYGYDGAAYKQGASITFYSSAAFSSTSSPARIELATTPVGSIAPTVRMFINTDGKIANGLFTPLARFHIKGLDDDQQLIVQGYATQTSALVEHQDSSAVVHNHFTVAHATNVYENVFNEAGSPNLDFRIETDVYNAIFVDASNDSIVIMSNAAGKFSMYGGTAVVRGAALTTQLTSITHTAPGTPDYTLQDLVNSSVGATFGFATKDEGNTLLSVVLNLQVRVAELEARLGSATGINAFA